jgi:hypothetical protein
MTTESNMLGRACELAGHTGVARSNRHEGGEDRNPFDLQCDTHRSVIPLTKRRFLQ